MTAGGQTNEHSEELTFGRLLKELRTQKGLDLKTISDETRIAVSTLRLLEEEAYDKLPDTVFVKGFLKSYAHLLETPLDPIIQNFLAGRHHHNEVLRFEAGRGKSQKPSWRRLIVAICVLAFILYGGIWVIKALNTDESPETSPPQTGITVPDMESPSKTDTQKTDQTQEHTSAYLLEINAVEETWLKIIVDRQDPKEYFLNPGDRLELKATTGFNLLIGNATGVNLMLNHRAIAVEGRHGQVVTLKLPR